jgi:predicted RNase H-like nuclease (RuvC/YqgF family)
MLQETNKFREHQSREILIEILELELRERQKLIEELERKVAQADLLLPDETTDGNQVATPMDES